MTTRTAGGAGAPEVRYAGFWRRLAAFAVDFGITSLIFLALAVILPILAGPWLGVPRGPVVLAAAAAVWQLVLWLYWAAMESSSRRSTVGKALLGLVVTDAAGGRLSFRRATGRHFGKVASTVVALAGFAMIAGTPRKQGLHDLLGGSVVVMGRQADRAQDSGPTGNPSR